MSLECLYRIKENDFKRCGTSIMLINKKGNIIYKILPLPNDTEGRFYQLANNYIFNNINSYLYKQVESDFDDINFLVRNNLIPKLYGFYYVKHSIIENEDRWHIVPEYGNNCSIAIGIENIIFGYKNPAVADIKLGLSYPSIGDYGTDLPKDEILSYINKWRYIKDNLRKSFPIDPIKAYKLIRQITPQMIGLPEQYSNYSNEEVYKLLKKWRQIQHSEDSTQSTLGLRICSMHGNGVDIKADCIDSIRGFFANGRLSRVYDKISLLVNWISKQSIHFCSTSLLIVYDQEDLEAYDVRWIDFNYIIPMKIKKSGDCDVNVLKGLELIKDICLK